jgi:hypothetical protein
VRYGVRWDMRQVINASVGTPVCLRFQMWNARLYSFQFKKE